MDGWRNKATEGGKVRVMPGAAYGEERQRHEQRVKNDDSDHIPDTGMIKYYMDTKNKLNYHLVLS